MKYAIIFLFLLAGCAPQPLTFCPNTSGVYSLSLPLAFKVGYTFNQDQYNAIEKAALNWNNALGRTMVKVDRDKGLYPIELKSEGVQNQEAVTETEYNPEDPLIQKMYIHVNPEFIDRLDVESLLIHEFGHALGLVHMPNNTNNVMYPYLGMYQIRTTIDNDAIAGVQCLYKLGKINEKK
jgi:Matrixin